jgi:hypothetical protein
MTTTRSATSTAIAVAGPVLSGPEQLALAGFLAGYTGLTRQAHALDLRSTRAGASSATSACSRLAARISSASPAIWKPGAVPGPPSRGG